MTPAPLVRFLPAGERDVDAIADYIAHDSLDSALRFYDAVQSDAQKLAAMPGMGPACEFRNPATVGIRFWPLGGFRNYLLFYRPLSDGVEVIRVLHGARDVERVLAGPA
jgi:toxin ParE1/3/4